jgi:hypothetical protein
MTTFNAKRLAVLVDALGRAAVRIAVARRLTRSGSHRGSQNCALRNPAPPDVLDSAVVDLDSADLARIVHDALAETPAADQPDPATTAKIESPAPAPPPPSTSPDMDTDSDTEKP